MTNRDMTRGRVARLLECGIERLRFYEKAGLITSPQRAANGYRIYNPGQIDTLRLIVNLSNLGFPLDSIREILTLATGDRDKCRQVESIAEAHRRMVRSKIADLEAVDSILTAKIDACRKTRSGPCPIMTDFSHVKQSAADG